MNKLLERFLVSVEYEGSIRAQKVFILLVLNQMLVFWLGFVEVITDFVIKYKYKKSRKLRFILSNRKMVER